MGNARSLMVWLVVLSLQLAPRVTYADVGPGQEVRAIRHDLPIILASRILAKSLTIDGVVVSGSDALAQTHTPDGIQVTLLSKRLQSWWFDSLADLEVTSTLAASCWGAEAADSNGITPTFLERLNVPKSLIDLASKNLPIAIEGARRASLLTPAPNGLVKAGADVECVPILDEFDFHRTLSPAITAENYSLGVRYGANDAPATAKLNNVLGRAPTLGESWLTPYDNSYFFFSAMVQSPRTVHVQAGTMVDVWFPFAVDPSKTYTLDIAHTEPTIDSVKGTLKDNTLHFVLPAFAVAPGAELMGEIDGD